MNEETRILALKYAAGYIGQQVGDLGYFLTGIDTKSDYPFLVSDMNNGPSEHAAIMPLHLRSIESLADTELIGLAHVRKGNVRGGTGRSNNFEKIRAAQETCKFLLDGMDTCWAKEMIAAYQYLQQLGIALPYYHSGKTYSVQELVEKGIVKLI